LSSDETEVLELVTVLISKISSWKEALALSGQATSDAQPALLNVRLKHFLQQK